MQTEEKKEEQPPVEYEIKKKKKQQQMVLKCEISSYYCASQKQINEFFEVESKMVNTDKLI